MDNVQLPPASPALTSSVNRIQPVTPGSKQEIQGDAVGTSKNVRGTAATGSLEQQLFALEQFVPVNILQNPQLLKAEWAWKLLVLQQLAMQAFMPNETDSGPSGTLTDETRSQSGTSTDSTGEPVLANPNSMVEKQGVAEIQLNQSLEKVMQTALDKLAAAPMPVVPTAEQQLTEQQLTGQQLTAQPQTVSEGTAQQNVVQRETVRQEPLGQQTVQQEAVQPETSSQQVSAQRQVGATPRIDTSSQFSSTGMANMVQMAEPVVHRLWQVISSLGQQADRGSQDVYLNLRTDPPILPFSSMNQETLNLSPTKTDENRLSAWVLEDRIISGVLDNPYERIGGGIFFTPKDTELNPPHHAVKWKADRQTRVGAGGKMIHRIRLEMQVAGHPLMCILTAQRPQLLVHFVSDQVQLRNFLDRGADVVKAPLQKCGWDLIAWTTGEPTNGMGEE